MNARNAWLKSSLLILLSFVAAGCAMDQMKMEKDPFRQEAAPELMQELPMDEYAKKNHGIVNVHRHGPGYDIMFTLNAGDSEIGRAHV